jgi:hypothetical protein
MFWAEFESALSTPYLYVTYRNINKLLAPCFKIIDLGDVGIGEHFHEIEDGNLGFAEEGSHYDERWYAIVG